MFCEVDRLADDVTAVVDILKLEAFVLVAHSMGGKVAQIVAARQPPGLMGLILLAPAPPEPLDSSPEFKEMVMGTTPRERAWNELSAFWRLGL